MRRRTSQRHLSDWTLGELLEAWALLHYVGERIMLPLDHLDEAIGNLAMELYRRTQVELHGPDCVCVDCFALFPDAPSTTDGPGPF